MSDLSKINDALDRIFHEEGARIVFRNDPEREFQNVLPFLLLYGVTTLRLDQEPALGVKIRLEREDPAGKYLLYSPIEEPDYENDWLRSTSASTAAASGRTGPRSCSTNQA